MYDHPVISYALQPLPQTLPWCVVITDFLTQAECAEFIAQSEQRGYRQADSDYPPSYRNNARQVVDSVPLAQRMGVRLREHAPATWTHDAQVWDFDCINERFRFCRYEAGQQFYIHQDGVFHRPMGEGYGRSFLTFMIYLTDGDEFSGGDTLFYAQGLGQNQAALPPVIARVRPRAGSLILFDHALWHAGELVTAGVKHIMRSDVMYKPQEVSLRTAEKGAFQPSHQGYVWALAAVQIDGAQIIASGGRDRQIRLWDAAGAALGVLAGHTQSVLGLAALPDGRLASVSRDRSLKIWSVAQRCCEVTVAAHESAILAVCAYSDGRNTRIATGSADAQIKLWNDAGALQGMLIGHLSWVWGILQLPHTGLLVSASEDGCIKMWDVTDQRCVQTLEGNIPLRALAVSVDGQTLFAGDVGGSIAIWRLRDGLWAAVTASAHSASVRRVCVLSPTQIATAGEDNYLRIWNLTTTGCLQVHKAFEHDNFVTDILPTADGCISCAYDGEIRRWAW